MRTFLLAVPQQRPRSTAARPHYRIFPRPRIHRLACWQGVSRVSLAAEMGARHSEKPDKSAPAGAPADSGGGSPSALA